MSEGRRSRKKRRLKDHGSEPFLSNQESKQLDFMGTSEGLNDNNLAVLEPDASVLEPDAPVLEPDALVLEPDAPVLELVKQTSFLNSMPGPPVLTRSDGCVFPSNKELYLDIILVKRLMVFLETTTKLSTLPKHDTLFGLELIKVIKDFMGD